MNNLYKVVVEEYNNILIMEYINYIYILYNLECSRRYLVV